MSAPSKVVRRAQAGTTEAAWVRWLLIGLALGFMFLFLVLPLAAVATEALRKGVTAYIDALKEPDAWSAIRLTLITAAIAVPMNLVFGVAGAWAIAKFEFRGKALLTLFMLGSMMIPPVLLLAPLYKMVVDLGLVDSLAGVIVPLMVSTYGAFLFRQACVSVPNEMLDAARLDGCSEIGIYFRVVMPLVRPMAAAFCLVAFLANWNAFFQPNIFLHSEDKLTVPVVLNLLLGVYRQKQGVFLAGTALAMIPPAVLFFFLQKEFISGLTSGAVKG